MRVSGVFGCDFPFHSGWFMAGITPVYPKQSEERRRFRCHVRRMFWSAEGAKLVEGQESDDLLLRWTVVTRGKCRECS
jgi:hypothetical protein